MRANLRFVGSFAAGSLLALSGCQESAEVRYRIKLEVDEDGAVQSGHSVWSWTLAKAQTALASPYDGKFVGEAIPVRLSNGRVLFAILLSADGDVNAPQMLPERLFGDVGRDGRGEPLKFGGDRLKDIRHIATRVGEERSLDCFKEPGACLKLVTFRDRADPTSIEVVDPANPGASLGKGVRQIRMSVQITDAPVTRRVAANLPEPLYKGFFNWDGKSPFQQRTAIGIWDFRRGT